MFLLNSLLVTAAVYWFSALLAEILLGSIAELKLHPIVRVGFGFFLSLIYFSSAWQLMPIQQAWILGGGLILFYSYGKFGFSMIGRCNVLLRNIILKYGISFFTCMLAAFIFFAPNLVARNFGPFTEGGGDITIYADTAKLLTDHKMTALGQIQPSFEEQGKTARLFFDFSIDSKYIKFSEIQNEFYRLYTNNLNPPAADVSAYRVVMDAFFSSIYYAPYAQFYFLSGATNYNVYFGIQAFLYACLLGGVWSFFLPFTRKISIFAVVLVAASHGLVSVYYNHYSMQGISLAITALILGAAPIVRLISWAGLRIYGSTWMIIAILYSHFLAVVTPLMLLAFIPNAQRNISPAPLPAPPKNFIRRVSQGSATVVFTVLSGMFLLSSGSKSMEFLQGLLANFFSRSTSVYLGEHIPFLSMQWLSFLFGFLSQQHYQPFSVEIRFLQFIIGIGVTSGVIALIAGAIVMIKRYFSGVRESYFYLAIYVVAILIVVAHLYLSRGSLYTQAKGTQNVLVYFYLVMLLPLAIGLRSINDDQVLRKVVAVLKSALVVFIVMLLVPRVAYVSKLAFNRDRAAILEASYFSEAEKIRRADVNPFVLFEPRKSADLYIGIQSFSDKRMVSTRHLVLQSMQRRGPGDWSKNEVLANELIKPEDIPHLWLLSAKKIKGGDVWISQRLVEKKSPEILLFAHDYERNISERPVALGVSEKGKFSYLRNGVAVLYMPSGSEGDLEITIEPRDEKDYPRMVEELRGRLERGEMGRATTMSADGKFVKLMTRVDVEDKSILKTLVQYSGQFWLNVKFNAHEL